GTLIADKYRVDALVGETSFGSLYRGTNTLLDRPVAIVSARPDGDNERFFEAARSAAKISHPNVLALQDFGTDAAGSAFAVHEAPQGEQLTDTIAREGRL